MIADQYSGGPVGIETISAAISESRDALEEVIEPYLLQMGLIQRTPRGRMLANNGWRHLGMQPPKSQGDMFEVNFNTSIFGKKFEKEKFNRGLFYSIRWAVFCQMGKAYRSGCLWC